MFNISDKVVCVDDSHFLHADISFLPGGTVVKGGVYCVERMRTSKSVLIVGKPAIHSEDGYDLGWLPSRFRKLSEVQAENRKVAAIANAAAIRYPKPAHLQVSAATP
jgi:hypothetical protein